MKRSKLEYLLNNVIREQLLDDLKNAELEATEIKQNIRLIRDRIEDRYNVKKVPQKMVVDNSEEQIEFEIAKIQRS